MSRPFTWRLYEAAGFDLSHALLGSAGIPWLLHGGRCAVGNVRVGADLRLGPVQGGNIPSSWDTVGRVLRRVLLTV